MHVSVVIHRPHRAADLAYWGWRLARAIEAELHLLWCAEPSEHTRAFAEGDGETFEGCPEAALALYAELIQQVGALVPQEATTPENAPPLPLPKVRIVCPGGRDRDRAVLDHVEAEIPDLLIVGAPEGKGKQSLANRLFQASQGQTMLLRLGGSQLGAGAHRQGRAGGALVASAGGPSARVALRLGYRLSRAEGAAMESLFLQTPMENATGLGEAKLESILEAAGLAERPGIERTVIVGSTLPEAIEKAAAGHDVVLLGASNTGVLRKLLYGTVPEKLLKEGGGVTVGVVREAWSRGERFRVRFGRWLGLRLPQLEREQRIDLYRRLEAGSSWSFDFMLLIGLSTMIAALGLLQNSAAVVIGAMLVAPLMTPILGVGLALLQGNTHLLREATRAVVAGYLTALAIGALCGLLAPPPAPTPELLARGGPTLLDMGVALFSGVAAAYCLGRPGLLAALPGVAIAAALVPPIATTGIALATGHLELARGASLLFGTNVVAIVLGAASSLFAIGVRAGAQLKPAQRRARLVIGSLLVLLVAFAVPLTQAYKEHSRGSRITQDAARKVGDEIAAAGYELVGLDCDLRPCRIVVAADRALTRDESLELARRLQEHLPGRPPVRLVTELSVLAP